MKPLFAFLYACTSLARLGIATSAAIYNTPAEFAYLSVIVADSIISSAYAIYISIKNNKSSQ